MEITLTEANKKKKKPFEFKPLPERINVRRAAKYKSHDLLNGNTAKLPKGRECAEISWNGIFLGGRGTAVQETMGVPTLKNGSKKKELPPKQCVKMLRDWMYGGKVLELLITEPRLRVNVTVSRLTTSAEGPYGDISYSIEFLRYHALNIKEIKKKSKDLNLRNGIPADVGPYTVKTGDCLWRIAADKLGDGNLWRELYDMNKKTIEDAAKKHGYKSSDNGHWIFPGTTLFIPASKGK